MATPQEVAELVQELDTIAQHLADAKARIEAEYSRLESELAVAAGGAPVVDLDPLKEAVGRLTPVADAVDSLKASPPVAAVAPAGEATGSKPEVTPPAVPAAVPAPPLTAGGDAFAPAGAHQTVEAAEEESAETAAEEAGEADAAAQGGPPA